MPQPNTRNAIAILLLTAATLVPFHAQAAEHWFSIQGRQEFADVRAQLQVVVDEHANKPTNRFCVVGQSAGNATQAWVYWPENNKLILWRPDRDNPHAIAGSNRTLDLKRDVAPGDDVHGSTYRITRATANETIRACKQHGQT